MDRLSRVTRLELLRQPRTIRPYMVEYQDGETPDQAIARTAPIGGFMLVPAQCASVEEWSNEAMEVLSI